MLKYISDQKPICYSANATLSHLLFLFVIKDGCGIAE